MGTTADFSGYWTGSLSGTNHGGFVVGLVQEGNNVTGTAKINEPELGVYEYSVAGSVSGTYLELSMTPSRNDKGLQLGIVTVAVELDLNSMMNGNWKSSIGTVGILRAERIIDEIE